jgi:putative addiction module killer protein
VTFVNLKAMEQPGWDIQKYVRDSGHCPFDDWFDSLTLQIQTRVDIRLVRMQLGNFGDYKSVGEGVFELRFKFGPGYRVYYALVDQRIVLLLVGGDKKSQGKDVKTAQEFWIDYKKELNGD